MAGTGSKVFGAICLVFGILLVVGGLASFAFAAADQAQHEEEQGPMGVGENRDRTTANQAMASAGVAGVVGGLLFLVVGIVFVAVGASAKDKPTAEPRPAPLQETSARPAPQRTSAVLGGLAGFAAILVVLGLMFVNGPAASDNLTVDGQPVLAQQSKSATFGPLLRAGGANAMGGPGGVEFSAPAGTLEAAFVVDWDPQVSTQVLRVTVYQEGPEGIVQRGQHEGAPGLEFDVAVDAGHIWVEVVPARDGYTQGQSVQVQFTAIG